MFKPLCLQLCLVLLAYGNIFQIQDVTKVRNGIENSLRYIFNKYREINVDCLLGVALTQAIIQDVYYNGSHLMDESSQNIIRSSANILRKTVSSVQSENLWVANSITDSRIWRKYIVYKENSLYPFSKLRNHKILENIYQFGDINWQSPNINLCLQDTVNFTSPLRPRMCFINEDCWKKYYELNELASGYILTHKLLLLQLAKARQCIMNQEVYDQQKKLLCSFIYAEVSNGDYYNELDDIFDLFLEEIVLCGYEGYAEFFRNEWLYFILKSQRNTGCFPAVLRDKRKSKIKRNINIFEDGCADHTTGLGAAALALYYNFIVKETFPR
ncbi:hypothetical protein JTB14_029459 [Gonioctena quinquepunctata]|nr:hypothetical protein JTB14_029459 [Gonioctena quinquepunctata]